MDTYHVVLYIHILSLLVGFSAGVVETVCLLKLRGAETLEAAVPWGQLAGQIEKAFPIAVIGLYATGAYMTHHFWNFSDSWVLIPIIGLAVIALQGPFVAGPRGHKLKHALMANGPGPLGEEARRLTVDRLLWSVAFTNSLLVLAIIWVMIEKPGWGGGIAALLIGYGVGLLLAAVLAKKPAVAATPASGQAA